MFRRIEESGALRDEGARWVLCPKKGNDAAAIVQELSIRGVGTDEVHLTVPCTPVDHEQTISRGSRRCRQVEAWRRSAGTETLSNVLMLDIIAVWLQNGGILEEPMATLNIKNMSDSLYKKLQTRAKRERRSVAQEVTHLLSEALEVPKPLSILELQGLGKELWQGIDAATHVQSEREPWD
jgi:plasmid stability protein